MLAWKGVSLSYGFESDFTEPVLKNETIAPVHYPGDTAEFDEIADLANVYYEAAMALFPLGRKGSLHSYAPARLCSIHAIELFLNAFLRREGLANANIRARCHNLADEDFVSKLDLRKKTSEHLAVMTRKREYLISRYAPELAHQHTELNRLQATLIEVRDKTVAHLAN